MTYSDELFEGDKPNQSDDAFYQLIGKCIKEWAYIENELFHLCEFSLGSGEKQAAVVFYRTPTIGSRLTLVSELLLAKLPQKSRKNGGHDDPLVSGWAKLEKAIGALLPTRNLLAHSPVTPTEAMRIRFGNQREPMIVSWLQVATSETEQLRGHGKQSATIPALVDHLKSVSEMTKRLQSYRTSLSAAPLAKRAPRTSKQEAR
jgi:hypothetical protein